MGATLRRLPALAELAVLAGTYAELTGPAQGSLRAALWTSAHPRPVLAITAASAWLA